MKQENNAEVRPTKPGVRCSSHLGCTAAVKNAIARIMDDGDVRQIRAELEDAFGRKAVDRALRRELNLLAVAIAAEEAVFAWRGICAPKAVRQ